MKRNNSFFAIVAISLFLLSPSLVFSNPPHSKVDNLNLLLKDLPSVMAEKRGETIVVTGWTRDESETEILKKILEKEKDVLDLTTPDIAAKDRMVEIDVVIVVVSETISSSVGFDFLQLVNMNYDSFGTRHRREGWGYLSPGVVGEVIPASQWGQILHMNVDYDVNIANADEQVVKIIARPHLTTLNGHAAEFLAGGEIVFKVQGIESGDIKPFPFGIQLNVTPTILKTKGSGNQTQVLLDVEASRLSVLGRLLTTEGKTSSDDVNFDKTLVKSKTLLSMNETLVLSGLYQREYRTRFSGVPILRKIPVLNMFFSNRTEVDDVLSTIVFLTPREPAILNEQHQKEIEDFIERRRRYIEAREKGPDAIKQFKEEYPGWYKPQRNVYASHFFLVNNSNIYSSLRSEGLRTEDIRRDLLDVQSAREAAKKRQEERSPINKIPVP